MLVSCIMPTRGRPQFASEALSCFRAQRWPEKQIVILDDEDNPSFPVAPEGHDLLYERMQRRLSIGAKRNLACSRASGDIICHFDDDDYSAPGRIADQVERLTKTPEAGLTGFWRMKFLDATGAWWMYSHSTRFYALGTSLMYTREFWRSHPFPSSLEHNVGEDNAVVQRAGAALVTAEAGELMWARIHPGNTSRKNVENKDGWMRLS